MKNKKKGLLHLLVIIAIIGLCSYTTLVGFTDSHKGSAQNIKLGLDLAGGVSITYQTVKDNPTETEMKDTISMMQVIRWICWLYLYRQDIENCLV